MRLKLRLRRLLQDPRLAPAHFERACGELLAQSVALAAVIEGSSVRIGFANRIAVDEPVLELAWDFEP